MIAINNELLDIEKKSPLVKHYLDCKKIIKGMGKRITLRYPAERITPANPNDPESRESKPQGFDVPMSATMTFDGSQAKITYYDNVINGGTDKKSYKPSYMTFDGYKILDPERDMDLIYFLLFISPYCAEMPQIIPSFKGERMSNFQNPQRKKVWFQVEDRIGDATQEVLIEKRVGLAKVAIFDDVNGVKDADITLLGLAWGISNAQQLEPQEIRVAINHKVLRTVRGQYDLQVINEFLEDSKMNDKLKIKAKILLAEKLEVIQIDRSGKNHCWKMLDENGEYKTRLCNVAVGMSPHQILVDVLNDDKELLEVLEARTKEKQTTN